MGFTIDVGTKAPGFKLPGVDGRDWALEDFSAFPILVIVFSCNHCPYVMGSEERMITFQSDYASRGVRLVAINSNETENHPGDSFELMIERAKERGFNFPYLRDESQDIAKAYGAMRTPHFYVFDADRVLRYNGRMDNHPKDEAQAVTHELRDAVDALLEGRAVDLPVTGALGCNVKWRGRDRKWMPVDVCDFLK
jgi:peroxiredoxin